MYEMQQFLQLQSHNMAVVSAILLVHAMQVQGKQFKEGKMQ